MSIVKFSHIVSCSSEDPKHPASNLLEAQVGKCWRSRTTGEKQIIVILQLERNCQIQSIDIGNENSAFIEIFVGRSAVPDEYRILRVASLLMSTKEAKRGENKNAVRFFKYEDFSKPAADEFWDRIKITCTQPFNNLTHYGLSFIRVRSKDNPVKKTLNTSLNSVCEESSADTSVSGKNSLLGKFKLKEKVEEFNHISVGSLFAKRSNLKESPSSSNVPLKLSSSLESTSKQSSPLFPSFKGTDKAKVNTNGNEVPPPKADGRRHNSKRLLYGDDQSDDETKNEQSSTQAQRKKSPKRSKAETEPLIFVESKREAESSESPKLAKKAKVDDTVKEDKRNKKSPTKDLKTKKQKTNKLRKPFNRLLEGVFFVISGYQNPFRSDLRSKAISMGAKYKADWDSTCTHLICAFQNTPKANQVRGKGWIVSKNWIEDCFSQRKRLLSRNYRLDKTDNTIHGVDEEIDEEIPGQKIKQNEATSSTSKKIIDEKDIYDVDTDVDSDNENNSIKNIPNSKTSSKVLLDFLYSKKFYLGADLSDLVTVKIQKHIKTLKGEVTNDIDDADFIISENDRYEENVANVPLLLPDQLWGNTD